MPAPIQPCLWFDHNAEEAATFYAATFADSRITSLHRAPGDYPAGKQGDALTVEMVLLGMPVLLLNGGPTFHFSEAISFQVSTADQAETDRLWSAIVDSGGTASQCGWCKDRFGLSWQITPARLPELLSVGGAVSKRVFSAMMTMTKIDIAALEAAAKDEAVA
jgi:predicted 3-demethylubiquinone-9 3-methyltransferase (glyoxalase superfamily)